MRSVQTKHAAAGSEEFSDFCQSALRIVEGSGFFAAEENAGGADQQGAAQSATDTRARLIDVMAALCIT